MNKNRMVKVTKQ